MNRISIITICFNNLEELQKTCVSVDMQLLKPYEHWVIDGSSKPDIKNWLENTPQPSYRKWISERDKGIADAFNKGINKAIGDILSHLNSGDELYDDTVLQRVSDMFEKDSSLMWINGKLKLMRGGIWVIAGVPFDRNQLYKGMRSVFHPTMYLRKEVFERRGGFDADIKSAMDFDFLCRIADEKNGFLDYPLAIFDPTGISNTGWLYNKKEADASYRKYFGPSMKQSIWTARMILLHKLMNNPVGKLLYRIKVKLGKA